MADLAGLVEAHLRRLGDIYGGARCQELLDRAHLVSVDGHVRRVDGGAPTDEDAYSYKQAVRAMLGPVVYAFARANFALGGCHCSDCCPRGASPRSHAV